MPTREEPERVWISIDDLFRLTQRDSALPERSFHTREVAAIFHKAVTWLYWGENGAFEYRDGSKIQIARTPKNYRIWTGQNMRDIAVACYNRGNLNREQVEAVLKRIMVAEAGGDYWEIDIPGITDKEPNAGTSSEV